MPNTADGGPGFDLSVVAVVSLCPRLVSTRWTTVSAKAGTSAAIRSRGIHGVTQAVIVAVALAARVQHVGLALD